MKEKIMTWLENHETIYGVGLLCASVCAAAFGGAYLGAQMSNDNNLITINLVGTDAVREYLSE